MRVWPLAALLFAPLALSAACSDDPDPAPTPPAPTPPVSSVLVVHPALFLRENEPLRMLSDGAPLDLWNATQGGHVALVAAQIEGISGDTIELRARFRDPATSAIIAEETRTVVVQPVAGDSTRKENDLRTRSQMTHVPLCPNYDARPVVDNDILLEVQVTELYTSPPRKGSAQVRVRPTCGELTETPEICRCECGSDYTLGKCK